MPTSLHPRDGLRILLELAHAGPGLQARYGGAILTPSERVDYTVELAESGAVSLTPHVPASHASLDPRGPELLTAVARTLSRHAREAMSDPSGVSDGESALPAWPRRILRWRRLGR